MKKITHLGRNCLEAVFKNEGTVWGTAANFSGLRITAF